MTIINRASEGIILRLGDLLFDTTIHANLIFLLNSQYWSNERLREYQNEKLRSLIHHSVETVPYYNDLFKKLKLRDKDIQTSKDLIKLPILTKDIIKEQGIEQFLSKSISKMKKVKRATSGSTGEPFIYFSTKDAYSANLAANLRGWYWMGFRLGDKYIKISNNPRSNLKKFQDLLSRNQCLYFDRYNPDNVKKILNAIEKTKPKILRSYPTPLTAILNIAANNNLKIPHIDTVTTTGSILNQHLRDEIKSKFTCEVFDSYSCEGGACVFECATHECYHSSDEYAITEIIYSDKNNGGAGRLISTDLYNYAMPFIRYDSQDYVELSEKECSCGRQLLSIKKIIGRDTDILITNIGELITPHFISIFFRNIKGVSQFQVRQEKIDSFKIFIIPNTGWSDKQEKYIQNNWKEVFGKESSVEFLLVDDIPTESSGKRRYIIRSKNLII